MFVYSPAIFDFFELPRLHPPWSETEYPGWNRVKPRAGVTSDECPPLAASSAVLSVKLFPFARSLSSFWCPGRGLQPAGQGITARRAGPGTVYSEPGLLLLAPCRCCWPSGALSASARHHVRVKRGRRVWSVCHVFTPSSGQRQRSGEQSVQPLSRSPWSQHLSLSGLAQCDSALLCSSPDIAAPAYM